MTKNKGITVSNVSIIGWGGGPGYVYGIDYYNGSFSVEESIGGILKFTALKEGFRNWGEVQKIDKDFVFYSAPNTIRHMS